MNWEAHRQAYVCRSLSNERIPSRRRSKSKALLWLALALLVPGGSVIGLVTWLVNRKR